MCIYRISYILGVPEHVQSNTQQMLMEVVHTWHVQTAVPAEKGKLNTAICSNQFTSLSVCLSNILNLDAIILLIITNKAKYLPSFEFLTTLQLTQLYYACCLHNYGPHLLHQLACCTQCPSSGNKIIDNNNPLTR
mmetsp:Transcript_28303/g.45865  ORF Transcript_28303/g.45865 Transcript_28303/m.45865 type:complete len:135 (+) Transcript_28303:667-1071(+)